jgi:hypothetical protein
MDIEQARKVAKRYLPSGTTYVANGYIVRQNANSIIYIFDVETPPQANTPVLEDLEELRLCAIQTDRPFFEKQGYHWQLGSDFLRGSKRKTKKLPNRLGND